MAQLRPDDEGYGLQFNFPLQSLIESKQYSIVITGHTHTFMVRTIQHLTVVNAGSLIRHGRPVCSVIDFERGGVEFFNVGNGAISSAESL